MRNEQPSATPPELDRPKRLTGDDRERYSEYVRHLYEVDGWSTREIAEYTGRGYGTVHQLLREHGTVMRPEGHHMGVPRPAKRQRATSNVLEKKRNGKWGPVG